MNRKFEYLTLNFLFVHKTKILFLFWGSFPILTSADDLNLVFLKEFTNHHNFYSSSYNLISCHDIDTINFVKLFSDTFRRCTTVRRVDKNFKIIMKEPQTFLLDLECSDAGKILQQANDLDLLSKPFQWLLLTKHELDDKNKNVSVTMTSFKFTPNGEIQEVMVLFLCMLFGITATRLCLQLTQSNFSENEQTSSTLSFESLNLLADSDLKIAQRISDEKIKVTSVYKVKKNLIEELLAEWSLDKGLIVLNSNVPAIRRWNLQGVKMSSSVVLTRPSSLEHLEGLVDKHIDTTTKVCYNIVKLYGDLFNVSISFKVDTEWGVLVNGSWTGMVGDLERHEIDFGSAPLFLRKDRMHILEYYASVTPTRTKFIFLSPPLSYSSNIFLMPFDTIVWFCCIGMVAMSCFLLYTAIKFEKTHLYGKEANFLTEEAKISFTDILILNIGAICLQGTSAQTQKPAGRIITLFLYLAYMFLYISYSAAIVAILQSPDTSIQTLTDFLKSPLKAGAEDVPYSQHYFKVADDEVRKAIYRKKIAPKGEPPHFLPVEEGIKEVKKGFYGYHVELSAGYQMVQKTFTEEEKCALQELKAAYIRFTDPWIVMKKNTPYAEHFKIGIKRLIERGFKSRFVRRYYTKKPICSSKSSRFVSVGIVDCYYAFVVLLSGLVLAISILLLEAVFSQYLKNKRKQSVFDHVGIRPQYVLVN